MATKIRLQRKGRKKMPYYYVVVADSRSPRDGKFIERLGSYNPNTNPATIEIDGDRALDWLLKGAQPTDTVRAMLSYKGIMMRKHLARGVEKGAVTQDAADQRFADWLEGKAKQIDSKISGLKSKMDEQQRARLTAESEVAHKRAQAIMAKNAPPAPAEEETATGEAEEGTENTGEGADNSGETTEENQ
jgi:small subunit ribosomal protein S16